MTEERNFRTRRKLDRAGATRLVNSRDFFWAERMRATGPRLAIMDLFQETFEPLSVEKIRTAIEQKIGTVHLATIYRTLNHLLRMDLIRLAPQSSLDTRKRALYEIKPAPNR